MAVLDTGALQDRVWNFEGSMYVPDFDLYIWEWAGLLGPGQQPPSANITSQIGNTNEPCWSNAEYDKLNGQQALRGWNQLPSARCFIDQMQQITYEQTPWVVLAYPQYLQAYNDCEVDRLDADVQRQGPCVPDDRLPQVVHRPEAGGL